MANRKFEAALEAALQPGETVLKRSQGSDGPRGLLLALTPMRLIFVRAQFVPPRPTVSDLPLEHVVAASCESAMGNMELWIESRAGDFRVTFNMFHRGEATSWPREILNAQAELASSAAAVDTEAAGSSRRPIEFDPASPERIAEEAYSAYQQAGPLSAFPVYVRALDRLHDLYVFERFRQRQPGLQDTWILEGLTQSLVLGLTSEPDADVKASVREATHRLRTIVTAMESNGANAAMYRGALDRLAGGAPGVDVSDIYW